VEARTQLNGVSLAAAHDSGAASRLFLTDPAVPRWRRRSFEARILLVVNLDMPGKVSVTVCTTGKRQWFGVPRAARVLYSLSPQAASYH
jgi:hypothetical protein